MTRFSVVAVAACLVKVVGIAPPGLNLDCKMKQR
jgi:hypothetical protein